MTRIFKVALIPERKPFVGHTVKAEPVLHGPMLNDVILVLSCTVNEGKHIPKELLRNLLILVLVSFYCGFFFWQNYT